MNHGTEKTLRVAVVGVGYLGRFHAEKYAAMDGVDLVGVVDTNGDRARHIAEKYGARACTDVQPIYEEVDAVSIVVPTLQHFAVAREFIRRGKDVMVEKPLTSTLPEATELVKLARQKKCILQVGHLERFNAVWQVAGPELDLPRFIEVHRLGPFQGRGTDVDVVLDLMIHDIDIVLKYVSSPVKRVDSVGVPVLSSNIDIANVRLTFENGTVANLTASRVSWKKTRKIRFFQPDVYVSVNYNDRSVQVFRRIMNPETGELEITGKDEKVPQNDALQDELEGFVRCVRTREVPEVGGEEGKRAMQVALRIVRNMRSE